MNPEFVKPDTLYTVNVNNSESYLVNAKYDRIDHFPQVGRFIIKCVDEEKGFVQLFTDEETATRVQEYTGIPIIVREYMFESEYEGHLNACAAELEENWSIED